MYTLAVLSGLLLVGFVLARPEPIEDIITLTDSVYKDKLVVYTGDKDITKIVVPLNSINFNDETRLSELNVYSFFIEEGKGLFVLKDGVATKLLDNGKDIASSADDSTQVFFGATDGIYTYNAEKKTAEKYGTLTDNIKNILVTNSTDEIYILTEDKVFYKVLDEGTKKEEVTSVKDAEQVVFDTTNNLYFVDSKKRLYVKNYESGIVKRVKGLPLNPKSVEIIRPPALIDHAVPFLSGTKLYAVNADGQTEFTNLIILNKPTAIAVEASLILYAAYDKKIYEYSLFDIVDSPEEYIAPVKSYLNKISPDLKEVAKKKALHQ